MKAQKYKTGTVTVYVDYGYDIHTITFSKRTFDQISAGKRSIIKGQGFASDGGPEQDYWMFNEQKPGSVYVYTKAGRDIFIGTIGEDDVWTDTASQE